MKYLLLVLLVIASTSTSLFAQQTTAERLSQAAFTKQLVEWETAQTQKIQQYLILHPTVPRSYTNEKGIYVFIHHIDNAGNPVYYSTRSNLKLAQSLNTDKLWKGGSAGLDLQGQNMTVSASRSRLGMWEPGATRTTHQEFGGRAITRDAPAFVADSAGKGQANHAAHVAGTMIASGVMANARGMANQATLDCYELTSEYSEQQTAGSEGMLVSNHSYGPTFSAMATSGNGRYDESAQTYDKIASNNRNYLQFHAAGNDRDDANNITYDIMLGGALAKNVVAIGAVKLLDNGYTGPSSVMMSDFSSYGPADDGRVKPDLVAPGVQIYSAYSATDQTYATIDGTSMASPGSAGSLFLLQQHYQNLKGSGKFMRSATLKGLAIHTAEEAGDADGPDYRFGWGLINVLKGANLITNSDKTQFMEETSLANGATYRRTIKTNGGAFKATICWTDVPGAIGKGNNDRTPSLVNDLDLRLISAANNSVVGLPWKLDPANPSNAATRGDNTVDNVEQIYVANLPAGTYYLQVTNKGTLQAPAVYDLSGGRLAAPLAASQDFSTFATGLASSPLPVRLVSFEASANGTNGLLNWSVADAVGFSRFEVERSTDSKSFERVGNVTYQETTSTYQFIDPNAAQQGDLAYYRLRLVDFDGSSSYSRILAVRFNERILAELKAYPNPVTERLLIPLQSTVAGTATIRLLNNSGRLVRQLQVPVGNTATQAQLENLSQLPTGTYILHIQTPSGVSAQKLVKD